MSGAFADWGTPGFSARFRIGDDQPAALVSFVASGGALADGPDDPQPLVELTTIGHGRFPGGYRHVDSTAGARLRPVSWRVSDDATDPWFRIVQADAATGLQVE
ncbi:hypothetical protein EDF48_103392 [Curtobacterium sp. PhB191]|uniref:hypothetical protein n=1 Tax=Curtobacterium sp. PhB191 TaxID=2485202 RepID=UPI0010CF9AEC|nr:hypothetical protein [Curtobacterium sp. PhB191]TCU86087.1 hypothetical protein EDF48_103392 [Curtobacterium sp. PhB191]